MPSPSAAQKTSAKKAADLGQHLAKKKSQDFTSKIDGWNNSGAGVTQEQDEVVVVEDKKEVGRSDRKRTHEIVVTTEPESDDGAGQASSPKKVDGATTPTTPKIPATGTRTTPKKQPTPSKPSREVDPELKAWVRRKSKTKAEITPEVKEAVAPKKRVVSDGHWRRDRQKKDAETPEKEKEKEKEKATTPKPVTVRRSVVSVGLKVPPSIQDFVQDPEPAKRRELTRRSRSRSKSRDRIDGNLATPDYESSGTKVYIKRRRKDEAKDSKGFNTSESSFTASSSFDKPSSATDITTPDVSPKKELPPRPSTAPRERSAKPFLDYSGMRDKAAKTSLEAEDVSPREMRSKTKTPVKDMREDRSRLPKTTHAVQSGSKPKIPATSQPTTVPKVFGNRIEGWLAGMGEDPFTQSSEPSLKPAPLKASRKASRQLDDSEDDHYDSGRRKVSGKSRRSRPSLEAIDTKDWSRPADGVRGPVDDYSDYSPAGTPTLKRSGARRNTHSPVKDRAIHDTSLRADGIRNFSDLPRSTSKRNTYTALNERGLSDRPKKRLSTLPSVRTAQTRPSGPRPRAPSAGSEHPPSILDGSVISRASDGDSPMRNGGASKRRTARHDDLISVLSLPREDDHPITSRRSTRTRRPRHEGASTGDLMNEVTTDELKYQRELRTLVDGVIPVLLQYVLKKDDSARSAGSRQSSVQDNPALTKPIYEMGIALERLKAAHKRIPMHDSHELLVWAQSTCKIYADYIQAWRLGFDSLVVNLAPAEETAKNGNAAGWDNGLQRTKSVNLPGDDGERVDVAYLLKRPLVRVKTFGKTFGGIDQVRPSALAEEMTSTYQNLVNQARQRANDERARLEDEAAAAIDPTRARDPRSLAPLSGVSIDPTRSVRARDYFDLDLYHSSGQQVGCKVEMIVRDDASDRGSSSDILFCEVSSTGRWLLFPPVLVNHVSARHGDKEGELVVMIRGVLTGGNEWREIMALQSSPEASAEWLDILGSHPLPPRLTRQSSFNALRAPSGPHNRPPSPAESEMPLGERARPTAPKWDGSEVNSVSNDAPPPATRDARPKRYRGTTIASPLRQDQSWQHIEDRYDTDPGRYGINSRRDDKTGGSQRQRPVHTRSQSEWTINQSSSRTKKDYSVWLPSSDRGSDVGSDEEDDRPQRRPTLHKRTSSVPSMDMPTVNKLRKASAPATPVRELRQQPVERRQDPKPAEPTSAPPKLQKRQPSAKEADRDKSPQIKTPSLGLRTSVLPSFTPAFLKRHRRSSSPLKHEYEPSTASESTSDSDLSDFSDNETVTSDSTADEVVSTIGELRDFSKLGPLRASRSTRQQRPPSIAEATETLGPSESASQAPYRNVPPVDSTSVKSVACISCWSERGSWDSLHPEECEIVVTPGLIEAFDLAQAHAVTPNTGDATAPSPSAHGVKPLVALELTPLVPLRRGTAVDISIRSPPTGNSVLRTGTNFMFRSRSPEECEKLYAMINRARIDNPTWIALQNARGPVATSNWAAVMDKRNAARTSSGSWIKSLSRRSGSYRSKGTRSASNANSQSSISTMNTAFSAIRRFSGSNRIFNIAKSTLTSKEGTRSTWTGSDSLSSGAATPVPFDPSMGTPMGITNAKIRMYIRESASKWRDLGSARLTIMLPPRRDPEAAADPNWTGQEKRIFITGKSKGETLLDATLGERSFERIARTGIAVSVWEEGIGPNGELGHAAATGGVVSSRSRIYMIQMRSERDAAYTFSMVGKLRY